jgi:hypothetical protein
MLASSGHKLRKFKELAKQLGLESFLAKESPAQI